MWNILFLSMEGFVGFISDNSCCRKAQVSFVKKPGLKINSFQSEISKIFTAIIYIRLSKSEFVDMGQFFLQFSITSLHQSCKYALESLFYR